MDDKLHNQIAEQELKEHQKKTEALTFHKFREASLERIKVNGSLKHSKINIVTEGLHREAGWLCQQLEGVNIKEVDIKDPAEKEKIMFQMASIFQRLDYIAHYYDIDLAEALRRRFNRISFQINSPIKI